MKGLKHSLIISIKIILLLISIYKSELCIDPSEYLQFVEGYETKIHKTTTEDGYNLILFQSLPKGASFTDPTPRKGI